MDDEARVRSKAQREKFIELFRCAKEDGVNNVVLKDISFNYTSRIAELRKQGFKFEVTDLGKGIFNYVLIYEPKEMQSQKRAVELFWELVDGIEGENISKNQLFDLLKDNKLNVVRNWGCNL